MQKLREYHAKLPPHTAYLPQRSQPASQATTDYWTPARADAVIARGKKAVSEKVKDAPAPVANRPRGGLEGARGAVEPSAPDKLNPSYLQFAGYGPTPRVRAKETENFDKDNMSYDPNFGKGPLMQAFGPLPGDSDAVRAAKRAILKGLHSPQPHIVPIPNAPLPVQLPPRGYLMAAPGEAIGVTERGEPIDMRGRKLGYLVGPSVATQHGDVAIRTGEYGKPNVAMTDENDFATATLEQSYGPYLKDLKEYNGEFPNGYFNNAYKEGLKSGMIPKGTSFEDAKKNIWEGVKELKYREALREGSHSTSRI